MKVYVTNPDKQLVRSVQLLISTPSIKLLRVSLGAKYVDWSFMSSIEGDRRVAEISINDVKEILEPSVVTLQLPRGRWDFAVWDRSYELFVVLWDQDIEPSSESVDSYLWTGPAMTEHFAKKEGVGEGL